LEQVQELQQEFKNLELILQGTQRENEKCMADLERLAGGHFLSLPVIWAEYFYRQKLREKMLERELTKLAGDNWQVSPVHLTTLFFVSIPVLLGKP